MEKKNTERLVYFRDLIFTVLYQWKIVVAVALVLALALGGYGAFAGAGRVDSETLAEAQAEYRSQKEFLQQRCDNLEQQVLGQNSYLAQSLLMQIDPYHHYEAVVSLYVKTDYRIIPNASYQNPNPGMAILRAYRDGLLSTASTQAFAQVLEIPELYVPELFSMSGEENTEVMTLRVKADTQQKAQSLLQTILSRLQELQTKVDKEIAQHQLVIIEQTAIPCVDTALAESQKKANLALLDVQKNLTEAQSELAGLAAPVAPSGRSVKKGILFALVGAFAGVALCACVIWVDYLTGSKVYSDRTLRNVTGVRVLGCVAVTEFCCSLNRLFRRLEGRQSRKDWSLVAADIRCRMDGQSLLITGGVDKESLVQELAEALPDKRVVYLGDVLAQPEALQALKTADAVVLLEQCGKSRYGAVSQRCTLVEDYGKTLLGCVLLDG